MRKAKDTRVELAEPDSYPNQHYGANAKVTWFQIEDGCDTAKHLFGIHSDGDLSLYVAANEGLLSRRQMVLSKAAALEFAHSIITLYGRKHNA